MTGKLFREEAKRRYESAQDELDSGAILQMHKKHYHTCVHACQAMIQALKAAWYTNNSEPGNKTAPELIRDLRDIDNATFIKLEKFIPDVEKILKNLRKTTKLSPNCGRELCDSPRIPPLKEFTKKDSEFFINTAYHILAEVKTIIEK